MTSLAAPIPLNTPSHLSAIFNAMYRSYSRDPVALGALTWSVGVGGSAYLNVIGCTATLYLSNGTGAASYQYNLATDGNGNRPTLTDFSTWLTATMTTFFAGGITFTVTLTASGSLSALTLVEGFAQAPTTISRATGLNYLQMRVMALMFDLMAADNATMIAMMNPATAVGMWLDWIGNFYALPRLSSGGITESDDTYQRRMSHTLAQPYENNEAIAALLATALGTPNLAVTDATPFNFTVWVFTPVPQPQLVVQLARSFAPAGTGITGMLFTPNSSAPSARMGTARMGTIRCGSGGNFTVLRG